MMTPYAKQFYYYTLEAKQVLMYTIYEASRKYHNRILNDIIAENNMIHGGKYKEGGVLYRGKEYKGNFERKIDGWFRSYNLDDSLVSRFDKYIEDTLEIEREQKTVSRMLSNLFSEDIKGDHIKFILGDSVYAMVSNPLDKLNYKKELSQEELLKLKTKYSQLAEILQNRLLTNLISQGLYDNG